MPQRPPTLFEFALLGLISDKPGSGYDLMNVFTETPLNRYSASPGAIYPALKRLQKRGLIEVHDRTEGRGRPRTAYRISESGTDILREWIGRDITPNDVSRSSHELMLRFVFSERLLNREAILEFLASFRSAIDRHCAALQAHLNRSSGMRTSHNSLALEHGLSVHELTRAWLDTVIAGYREDAHQNH
jgi:DNA-binding PadR family transcriptional regulator